MARTRQAALQIWYNLAFYIGISYQVMELQRSTLGSCSGDGWEMLCQEQLQSVSLACMGWRLLEGNELLIDSSCFTVAVFFHQKVKLASEKEDLKFFNSLQAVHICPKYSSSGRVKDAEGDSKDSNGPLTHLRGR